MWPATQCRRHPVISGVGIVHLLFALAHPTLAAGAAASEASWPNGPFVTSGRWITDAGGVNVTYAGVNWPGAGDIMVPEGLQYQSVEAIVSRIKGLGMNAIRLTYATEMVDQVYENGGQDVAVRDAFIKVMGEDDGAAVHDKIVANNPNFTAETTRLEVGKSISLSFSYVATTVAKIKVMMIMVTIMTMEPRYSMLLQRSAQSKRYTSI